MFIKCLVESDVYALVIKGTPTIADLTEAWSNLFSEYLDLNNDNEALYILNLEKEIATIQTKIYVCETLLFTLRTYYDERLVQELEQYEIYLTLDPNDQDAYQHFLDVADMRLAPAKLALETKEKELNEYKAEKQTQNVDSKYFQRMLIRLSKHQSYRIKAEDVTVSEFIMLTHEFFEYYKKENKPLENVD